MLEPVFDMGVRARLTESILHKMSLLPFLIDLSFEAHFSYEIMVRVVISGTLCYDCETPHTLVLEVLLSYFLV